MNTMSIQAETDGRIITCILPKGAGKPLIEAIHQRGITTANIYYSRGSNVGDPIGKGGMQLQEEKEILTVVVSKKEADDMFEFVVETAGINQPGGGFVYMGELRKSIPFLLPDVAVETKPA